MSTTCYPLNSFDTNSFNVNLCLLAKAKASTMSSIKHNHTQGERRGQYGSAFLIDKEKSPYCLSNIPVCLKSKRQIILNLKKTSNIGVVRLTLLHVS